MLPGGLVVWLLGDDLAPISGAAVTFEAVAADSAAWLPSLYVTRDTAHLAWGQLDADTTDTEGRAWTALRLGCNVGTARIRVRMPAQSIDTVLTFNVVPGAAVRVQLSPPDTAVMTAHTVTLRGGVVDRCGNPRPEPITIAVDSHATVLGPGLKLGGGTVGLARVIATSDSGWADTARITVVPAAVLAAYNLTFQATGVVAMNLDGSGYRVVSPQSNQTYGVSWGPQNSMLFGSYSNQSYSRLTSVSPQGSAAFVLPSEVVPQNHPRPSADGLWIYYGRNTNSGEIWRVHPDGTGNVRVGPANTSNADSWPWPSPDGTRVVFAHGVSGLPTTLSLLTLATGQAPSLGVACVTPSWSPDGTRLACVNSSGSLLITQTDGTVLNTFPVQAFTAGLAWTPDNLYVVVTRAGHLELVNVQTGETLALPFTTNWIQPSLRPYP